MMRHLNLLRRLKMSEAVGYKENPFGITHPFFSDNICVGSIDIALRGESVENFLTKYANLAEKKFNFQRDIL